MSGKNKGNNQEQRDIAIKQRKEKRKQVKTNVSKPKKRVWKKFDSWKLNSDRWGEECRTIYKRLKLKQKSKRAIGTDRKLFPNVQKVQWMEVNEDRILSLFNVEEMKRAMLCLKNKKTPNPDHITSEIVKITLKKEGKHFVDVAYENVSTATFPSEWKVEKLVLIEKSKMS